MQIVGSNISEMCLSVPPNSVGCGPKKWSPKMIFEQKIHSMKHGEIEKLPCFIIKLACEKTATQGVSSVKKETAETTESNLDGWGFSGFWVSEISRRLKAYHFIYPDIYIYIYTCIHQHIICVFIRTLYYAYSLVISIYILCNIYNVSSSYLYHTIWWFLPVAVISTSWKIGQSCPFCGASLNHPKEFDWVSKKSVKKNCKQKSFSKHLVVIFQPPKQWLLDWMLCPQSSVRLTHRGVGVGPEAFSSLAPWIFSRTCAMKIEELYPWNGAHHRPSKSKKWDSSQKNPWWF